MACGYVEYVLEFDGDEIPDIVNGITTKSRRLNQIAERTSLWNTNVIIDGRWPQIVWEHRVAIYTEKASRTAFSDFSVDLADMHYHEPRSLKLIDNLTDSVAIDFGLCYLTEIDLETPEYILLYEAGIHVLSFIGTLKPVVT